MTVIASGIYQLLPNKENENHLMYVTRVCSRPWRLQLALHVHKGGSREGDLTLHPLMELFLKLAAVLLCDTCKVHSFEEDFPSTMVTVSLPPFVEPFLNSCFFVKSVGHIALIDYLWSKPHPLQDGSAFASSLSADILSEEDSISFTHCSGDKRWDTDCCVTAPTAAAQWPCSASHEQNQSTCTCSLTVYWL